MSTLASLLFGAWLVLDIDNLDRFVPDIIVALVCSIITFVLAIVSIATWRTKHLEGKKNNVLHEVELVV